MRKKLTRRQFGARLSNLGIGAMAANTLGVSGLLCSSNAMAQADDYKALVYVNLFGGNDSFKR